jgi:hypothetical protein
LKIEKKEIKEKSNITASKETFDVIYDHTRFNNSQLKIRINYACRIRNHGFVALDLNDTLDSATKLNVSIKG